METSILDGSLNIIKNAYTMVVSEITRSGTKEKQKTVPCLLCGGRKFHLVHQKKGASGEVFPIVRCTACGLLFVNPRKSIEEIADIYSGSNYFQRPKIKGTGYENYTRYRKLHGLFFARQLKTLETVVAKGRLLDVGCAFGFMLDEARKRGWQPSGVDLSDFAVDYARNELGLDAYVGRPRDIGFDSSEFSAVVMDDLIEHTTDPLAEFKEVYRLLKPGGALILHTPNIQSLWYFFMRKYWVHMKPEEHLVYFSKQTITAMLKKAGFQVRYAHACSKVTNADYILSVFKKYFSALGIILQFGARLFPKWAEKPFWFPSGGMEVLAVKGDL
jgi:SAM-dependent methyltransferase